MGVPFHTFYGVASENNKVHPPLHPTVVIRPGLQQLFSQEAEKMQGCRQFGSVESAKNQQ